MSCWPLVLLGSDIVLLKHLQRMRMKPHLLDAFRIHLRDVNLGRVVIPMAAPLDAMLRLKGPGG